jgi:hypothetical protein
MLIIEVKNSSSDVCDDFLLLICKMVEKGKPEGAQDPKN